MHCLRLSLLTQYDAVPLFSNATLTKGLYAKWLPPNLILLPITNRGSRLNSVCSWICCFQTFNAKIVYPHNSLFAFFLHCSFPFLHCCSIWPSFPFVPNSPLADGRPRMPSPGYPGSSSLPCPSSCQSCQQRKQATYSIYRTHIPLKYQAKHNKSGPIIKSHTLKHTLSHIFVNTTYRAELGAKSWRV